MKGRDLQRKIVEKAQGLGWRVATFPPVETSRGWRTPAGANGKGWPDMALVRERFIVAEVKGSNDRLKPEQALWLTAFRMAGIAAYLWTPECWEDGIDAVLRERTAEMPVVMHVRPEDIERMTVVST